MDVPLEPRAAELLARAKSLAADYVGPRAETWERERRLPREVFERAAAAELTGLLAPSGLGGAGVGPVALAQIVAAVAAVDFGVAFPLVVHNNHVGAIARRGSPAQHERYLADLIAARRIGAFLLTEPGVGSDAAAIATTARRDGRGWILEGEKAWVTNGCRADLLMVYAQTRPGSGHRGIAAFLVEASAPGVERSDPYELFGGHAIGTAGVALRGVAVDADALLVPPGDGFRAALEGIDLARALVAAMCCAMLRTGLTAACGAAGERHVFGQPVAAFQGIRWKLADVATDLEAAQLLSHRALSLLGNGERAALAAAHAKKFATRAAERGLAECMQAMGADGARRDHPLPRHLAAARLAQYVDGTTEIQNVVISRALFR